MDSADAHTIFIAIENSLLNIELKHIASNYAMKQHVNSLCNYFVDSTSRSMCLESIQLSWTIVSYLKSKCMIVRANQNMYLNVTYLLRVL